MFFLNSTQHASRLRSSFPAPHQFRNAGILPALFRGELDFSSAKRSHKNRSEAFDPDTLSLLSLLALLNKTCRGRHIEEGLRFAHALIALRIPGKMMRLVRPENL